MRDDRAGPGVGASAIGGASAEDGSAQPSTEVQWWQFVADPAIAVGSGAVGVADDKEASPADRGDGTFLDDDPAAVVDHAFLFGSIPRLFNPSLTKLRHKMMVHFEWNNSPLNPNTIHLITLFQMICQITLSLFLS